MKKEYLLFFVLSVFILSGCIVRTYQVTKDRTDQDLTAGNRGYLQGQASAGEKERKPTRTTQIVEVEMFPPIKFERLPKKDISGENVLETEEDQEIWGNRGYITESKTQEMSEAKAPVEIKTEQYTAQKGDTLQKISQRFYGTTKKWLKIYEANKDVLKSPDKVYPGQVLNIPLEQLKEVPEKIK